MAATKFYSLWGIARTSVWPITPRTILTWPISLVTSGFWWSFLMEPYHSGWLGAFVKPHSHSTHPTAVNQAGLCEALLHKWPTNILITHTKTSIRKLFNNCGSNYHRTGHHTCKQYGAIQPRCCLGVLLCNEAKEMLVRPPLIMKCAMLPTIQLRSHKYFSLTHRLTNWVMACPTCQPA